MSALGPKSIDGLRLAELHALAPAEYARRWRELYAELAVRYGSERVVDAAMERLARRGYIDYGVSERTGWLTAKGRAALAELGE